jgi:hypothetical protein
MDIEKLEALFSQKYALLKVEGNPDATYENWVSYCDKHKIFLLHPDWLVESINEGRTKGMVCVYTPENEGDMPGHPSPWLLVPRKLAERALILGYLP